MNTNKFFYLITASLLSGVFCAFSAMAEAPRPDAYQQLTAVEMQPGHTPRLAGGFGELSMNERRYGERLPVQLDGAMKKVKATKYKHSSHKHKVRKTKTKRS